MQLLVVVQLLLLLSIVVQRCNTSSTPGYIMVECDEGLSNRLRVLLTHLMFGKVLHKGAHLVMVWDVNDACPGHFLQLFHPLKKVSFTTSSAKATLAKHAMKVYDKTSNGFLQSILVNNETTAHQQSQMKKLEFEYLRRLRPLPEITLAVEMFVSKYNPCNMSAMHVRKTDMERELHHMKRTNIKKFYEFVDSRPAEEKVFLLTDDMGTQWEFTNYYGPSKITLFSNMSAEGNYQQVRLINESYTSLSTATGTGSIDVNNPYQSMEYRGGFPIEVTTLQAVKDLRAKQQRLQHELQTRTKSGSASTVYVVNTPAAHLGEKTVNSLLLPSKHRSSTVTHTLIEILIAARAHTFRRSAFSSVSELVINLHRLHRWRWCGVKELKNGELRSGELTL